MAKRANGPVWWVGALLAGVLLVEALLLFAWSVKKPWLPGYLDLHLRGIWWVDAFLSLAASFFLMLNLWEASRGRFRWYTDGLVSGLTLFMLWAILLPVTVSELHPAAYAKLEGRNLKGAPLSFYSFAFANLRHADLTNADLRYSSFWGADLTEANLTGAKLNHAWLWHVRGTGANLARANLEDAVLRTATLQGAWLHNADLKNARLNDLDGQISADDRGGANLRGADLTGADLRGTTLQGALLTGARYDSHTRWPARFEPVKHGAIKVGQQ
jgi:hypothetical protein